MARSQPSRRCDATPAPTPPTCSGYGCYPIARTDYPSHTPSPGWEYVLCRWRRPRSERRGCGRAGRAVKSLPDREGCPGPSFTLHARPLSGRKGGVAPTARSPAWPGRAGSNPLHGPHLATSFTTFLDPAAPWQPDGPVGALCTFLGAGSKDGRHRSRGPPPGQYEHCPRSAHRYRCSPALPIDSSEVAEDRSQLDRKRPIQVN